MRVTEKTEAEAKAEANRLKALNKIKDPKILKNLKVPVAQGLTSVWNVV